LDTTTAFDEGHLASGDGHMIWYAQYGRPDGIPLFWLHGGPGSGSSLRHLQLLPLSRYRVVLADQRGCGRSLPAGSVERNDTAHLVDDISRLRAHLRLGRIVLGGGSWGAALALAYAAQHAATLRALVLRAPFLAGGQEVEAFFQPPDSGSNEHWKEFAALAPASERRRLLPWLAQRLASAGREERARIARGWRRYEQQREGGGAAPEVAVDDALIVRYRVQSHYLLHGCFIGREATLAAARGLRDVPAAILHGAGDLVCPADNARMLRRCLPGSRLRIVNGAGHDPFHPGMATALAQALDCFDRRGSFTDWGRGHD